MRTWPSEDGGRHPAAAVGNRNHDIRAWVHIGVAGGVALAQELVDVGRPRQQCLPPAEGEQASGEIGAVLGGAGKGFVLTIVPHEPHFSGPPAARGILVRADRLWS